jgi:hypothetical protein
VAHLTVSMTPNFTTFTCAPQKYGMAAWGAIWPPLGTTALDHKTTVIGWTTKYNPKRNQQINMDGNWSRRAANQSRHKTQNWRDNQYQVSWPAQNDIVSHPRRQYCSTNVQYIRSLSEEADKSARWTKGLLFVLIRTRSARILILRNIAQLIQYVITSHRLDDWNCSFQQALPWCAVVR